MNARSHAALPDAEYGILGEIIGRFRLKQHDFDAANLISYLLILISLFVGVTILSRIVVLREKRQLYNHPRALYRALCRVHRLDWTSRRLLRRIARWHRLNQPAQLFLDPERFEPATLSPALAAKRKLLERVRTRLFAEAATPMPTADAAQGFAAHHNAIAAAHISSGATRASTSPGSVGGPSGIGRT